MDEQLAALSSSSVFQGLQVDGKHLSRLSETRLLDDGQQSPAVGPEDRHSLEVRIKHAMRSKNITPMALKEMFLPSEVVGKSEVHISLREVTDVLEMDLGIAISTGDEDVRSQLHYRCADEALRVLTMPTDR